MTTRQVFRWLYRLKRALGLPARKAFRLAWRDARRPADF
ncbi:MAG: hypothetical protein QG616_2423 [Pseudomonadota bacterium]|jgi:hypothetical protein|nr:hypothetical protein [Pseudomonadota bacterium]